MTAKKGALSAQGGEQPQLIGWGQALQTSHVTPLGRMESRWLDTMSELFKRERRSFPVDHPVTVCTENREIPLGIEVLGALIEC